MLKIEYSETGLKVSDFEAEKFILAEYELSKNGEPIHLSVSTMFVCDMARALICEGTIPHQEIEFLYKGRTLKPNKDGRLEHWPEGFCDAHMKILERLLRRQENESVKL